MRSYDWPKPKKLSPSGLERFLPRTSSPTRESLTYMDNNALLDPYEMFRTRLDQPPRKASVRGMEKPPYHFISGHFIPPPKPRKLTLKARFARFKTMIKAFFTKYYWSFGRNKCDYCVCPPTCQCQKVKSLLNKTAFLDDDEEINEAQSRVNNDPKEKN
ncbi:hypothetical protein Zmor_012909 [Zophobas morio]|uniref:Uncharacterized protein n=2 Tax=Zophobas morio TaxID=2755281 RepID=A0AA38IC56_9CUCU|nr:hypothetical protein Zmor_012909 [Zophobas morio]